MQVDTCAKGGSRGCVGQNDRRLMVGGTVSITSLGGVPVLPRHRLTCHCGAEAIELDLPDGIVEPRRCDCSICRGLCGIYTHHQRRSFPNQYGFNVGCLEGINPFLLGEVPVNDGVNHPADSAAPGTA